MKNLLQIRVQVVLLLVLRRWGSTQLQGQSPSPPSTSEYSAQRGQGFWDRLILGSLESFI